MRVIFLLLGVIPMVSAAQINRSATELSHERIQEYLHDKLFKNKLYKPVSFGDLKFQKQNNSEATSFLVHKFEISSGSQSQEKLPNDSPQVHTFIFYLDDKMKVVRAESIQNLNF